ncbi:MAG: LLM class flavin-dependent oxidoreductase [Actinomycetota bacterium]
MTVRIGIGLFTGQLPADATQTYAESYRETLELVRLAEALGFDSAWVSEHHGASDGYFPSLLVMLAAFAEATNHIRLGTGVILTPFHDPLRLAEDVATVDQLSEGRLTVGLGLGWREEEFRMFGQPIRERLARTRETVEVLRLAAGGERFSFHGSMFDYDRVRVTPPAAQTGGPPVILGGYTDAALRRAGEIGDGHITDADDAAHIRHAVTLMEDGARGKDKDPGGLHLVLMQNAWVSEPGRDWWTEIRDGVFHQLGMYEAWEDEHDTPAHDSAEPSLAEEDAARAGVAGGTAEEVIHRLRPVVEEFGHRTNFDLIVRLHYPGMAFDEAARAVERFGENVIPALKGS